MKTGKLFFFLAVLCLSTAAFAQTTAFVYQGKLTDNNLSPSGSYDLTFTLWDDPTAGNQIGSLARPAVPVSAGVFSVNLDFGAAAFSGANRYLEIAVRQSGGGSFTTLSPRQQMTSAPYSIRSLSAANADVAATANSATTASSATTAATAATATNFSGILGGDVTGTQDATVVSSVGGLTAANVAAGSQAANNAASATGASTIVKRDASGNFSAGTITAALSGNATTATTASNFSGSLSGDIGGTQSATVIQPNSVTAAKIASNQVVKSINGARDAVTFAGAGTSSVSVVGSTVTITGGGISGVTAGSGLAGGGTSGNVTLSATYGGDGAATTLSRSDHTHSGQTWSCSGTGCITLKAYSNDTDVNSAALLGQINSPTGHGVGVWGETKAANADSAGVYAASSGGSSKALWATASGSNAVAVYGIAASPAKAGLFDGNVQINGTLSKSAGSFKIDHPLDPDNKYLYHSFVESPDMKNIYDGNVTTDENGNARVTMPDWFEALNRDYRYQVTVIGQFAQAIISQEIKNGQFSIKTDKPNVKVSWQVTGVRHDKYADDNRIPVEEDKKPDEKGLCLYAPACKSSQPMRPLTRLPGKN